MNDKNTLSRRSRRQVCDFRVSVCVYLRYLSIIIIATIQTQRENEQSPSQAALLFLKYLSCCLTFLWMAIFKSSECTLLYVGDNMVYIWR